MWADTIQIIKNWIASSVYKPSAAAYRSHCVTFGLSRDECRLKGLAKGSVSLQDKS